MAEDARHRCDIRAARDHQTGGGVPEGMDDEKRKKLLRLLDAQNILLEEATLMSFAAGFKLAWGIAEGLGAPYSYDTDEEQTAQDAHSKD